MWLPWARNLHSARETWKIRADIETSMDKLVGSVENIETDEHMVVHKVCVLKTCATVTSHNYVHVHAHAHTCVHMHTLTHIIMQVDKERNFVQIYSFTAGCNWLDVVEVHFSSAEDPSKI